MTCKFCNGWGYIEICEGIGPKVDCPHCTEKEVEVDAGELACETTSTINVTDPDAVIAELAEAKETDVQTTSNSSPSPGEVQ